MRNFPSFFEWFFFSGGFCFADICSQLKTDCNQLSSIRMRYDALVRLFLWQLFCSSQWTELSFDTLVEDAVGPENGFEHHIHSIKRQQTPKRNIFSALLLNIHRIVSNAHRVSLCESRCTRIMLLALVVSHSGTAQSRLCSWLLKLSNSCQSGSREIKGGMMWSREWEREDIVCVS